MASLARAVRIKTAGTGTAHAVGAEKALTVCGPGVRAALALFSRDRRFRFHGCTGLGAFDPLCMFMFTRSRTEKTQATCSTVAGAAWCKHDASYVLDGEKHLRNAFHGRFAQ